MLEINNRVDFAPQVKAVQESMSEIARQEEAIIEAKKTIGATVSVFLYEKLSLHYRGEFLTKLLSLPSWKIEEGNNPEDCGPILKRMCNSGIIVGRSSLDVSFMSVSYPVKEKDIMDLFKSFYEESGDFLGKLDDAINTINIIFVDIIKIKINWHGWHGGGDNSGYIHFGCGWKVAVQVPS